MNNIILTLVCCCTLLTSTAQPAAKPDLNITVQEGIELLSVIQYLGSQLGNSTPSPYKQALKKYFLPYRGHPAVATIFLFDKTVYPDLTEFGFLFYNYPDIRMRPMPDSSTWYRLYSKKELELYLRQCMQFYKDTKFHTFYTSHQSDYAAWGNDLRQKMEEPAAIFSKLFTSTHPLHWLICLDPLNDWGAHTIVPQKLSPSMQDYIVYQVGYFGDKDSSGGMTFKLNVYDFTWHESAHAISDVILRNYRTQIDSLSYLLKGDDALKKQNISDWPHYFDELIARSVSIALYKQYRSTADYEKLLQFETGRGFIHVKDVADVIYNDFVHEKRVSRFEDVFPGIFSMLRNRYTKTNN